MQDNARQHTVAGAARGHANVPGTPLLEREAVPFASDMQMQVLFVLPQHLRN